MAKQRKQFAVIGLGRFGQSVCNTLYQQGHEVLAMDASAEITRDADAAGIATHVLQADSTDPLALQALDVSQFDTVVVAIGTDLEASILTVLNLLELGVRSIVAKAANDRHGQVLKRIGGDSLQVVYPEKQMGERIANSISGADILETIELSPSYSITEVHPPRDWIGKSLAELDLRSRHGVTVIALKRGPVLTIVPSSEERLHSGDVITMLGPNERLDGLQHLSE